MELQSSDRFFDLTLRALTLLVMASIVVCLTFLLWRTASAPQPTRLEAALEQHFPPPVVRVLQEAERVLDSAQAQAELVLNPGHVYRCKSAGRVLYTDRPCVTATAENALR